ncbi:MAG: hypothetical protein F4Z29_02515, partial [Gemmatimonadetes bacterium]|nr:hypothetical protein [Gemmatimonadota bacterium]
MHCVALPGGHRRTIGRYRGRPPRADANGRGERRGDEVHGPGGRVQCGVIGTGWQARSQLAAVCGVREVTAVKAFGRDPSRRETYCREMSEALGVRIQPVDSARACVEEAEVVVTITSSAKPVLEGAWLAPGAHVNAAGSNALVRSEIDAETV